MLSADLDRLSSTRALWGTAEDEPASSVDEAVRAAVASALTEKQRAVVEASFFEGLSQGEIARKLGVTQQVVEKSLHGALRGGRRVGGALARLRAALAPLRGAVAT